jgi:hypothetical protein
MLSPVKALLDANVLYSNHLRNLLLQLAQNDVFDARWSELIEQEWLRNMEPSTRARIAKNTVPLIRDGFPGAIIGGFDPDRIIGKTHWKDRHVASAAAAIAPSVLVTENLKDFDFAELAALDVAVQTPDDFLADLFDANPALVEAATREAHDNLKRSAPTWDEYLTALADRHRLPKFVERLRSWKPEDIEQPATPGGPEVR